MSASGADRVVQALRALGVDVVFGLPGVHNLAIWRALRGSEIRLIGVRHEQAAVYAADGYARTTGRLGVALVTTGPGAANTLGATGEAFASGSPVLVIATDIPSTLRRPGVYRGVLHETRDQAAMFAPVCRAVTTVASADAIADAVRGQRRPRAGRPQRTGLPGHPHRPAGGAGRSRASARRRHGLGGAGGRRCTGCGGQPREVAAAAELLGSARTPLIWAGGGAVRAGAGAAVTALAERLGAPVITTYAGRGLLAPDHPCAVPGPVHHPAVGALWDRADVVVAIGSDLDGMMTQNWAMPAPPGLVAINVDAADASKNYAATVTVGDARVGTERSARTPAAPEPDRCLAQLRAELAAVGEAVAATVAADDAQAAALLAAWTGCLTRPRWWCATCASPGTGSPASGRCRRRGGWPIRWGGGRSASPFRPPWGRRWPGPGRWCASPGTAASCSPAGSWPRCGKRRSR